MIAGDLFVNLGVKGADKSIGDVEGVNKAMKGLGGTSLLTKAAIVGVFYSLKQIFSSSAEMGAGIKNVSTTLGMMPETLQRYQYAANLAQVSTDQMNESFSKIQQTMADVKFEGKISKELTNLGNALGLANTDIVEFSKNPEKFMQAAQAFANLPIDLDFKVKTLGGVGFNQGMIAALLRNKFSPEILAQANPLSDRQVDALDQLEQQMTKIGIKIKRAMAAFSAANGGQLVADFDKITTSLINMATAFNNFSKAVQLSSWISGFADALADSMNIIVKDIDMIQNLTSGDDKRIEKGKEQIKSNVKGEIKAFMQGFRESAPPTFEMLKPGFGGAPINDTAPAGVAPSVVNNNYNNVLNFDFTTAASYKQVAEAAMKGAEAITGPVKSVRAQTPAVRGGH